MEGFDSSFATPEEYILGITKEIWEDRGIATLHRYYAPDVIVRSPGGLVEGNGAVIAATMATMAEIPDRRLLGEDVIWADDGEGGFLSSHRILSTGTHGGDGVYGPATGIRFRYRVIGDCATSDNQIYDEWIIRDQGSILRQLGSHPREFARSQIEREGGLEVATAPLDTWVHPPSRYKGRGNDHEAGVRYEALLEAIMEADFAAVSTGYDRAVQAELPGGTTVHGRSEVEQFWIGLRSALPSAEFTVHHRIGRSDNMLPPRAAVRWTLNGIHSGWGAFGPPSGAQVCVMGICHAEFGPYGLRREWVLIDETTIWKQILLHLG